MSNETTSNNEEITVKPQSKNHARFLIVLGCCLMLISFLLNTWFWDNYKFQLMLVFFACSIVLLIGILKYSEPETSYRITRERLSFYHRNGHWGLPWRAIHRIGTMNAYIKGDLVQLPYIGIRLNNIENIVNNISPRLANKLIHEQKELLILAAKNNEITLDNGLISFEPFTLNKKTYSGPLAAWLYRTEQLVGVYGYHLYLPETSLDRDLQSFLNLLRQCKHHATS